MAGQKIDELFWDLGANTAPLVGAVGRAQKSLRGLGTTVLKVKVGLAALGAVAVLAFIKATKAAAKLDAPLREVSTLLDQTVEQMGDLRNAIISLSSGLPGTTA